MDKFTVANELKNKLKKECFVNGHSFNEELKFEDDGAILLTTIVGGSHNGNVCHTLVASTGERDSNNRLLQHYTDCISAYCDTYYKIPKNL